MKFADLLTLVDLVISPKFDMPAAEARFGKVRGWVGQRAEIESKDPSIKETTIETLNRAVIGAQIQPKEPVPAKWDDINKALKDSVRGTTSLDDIGGPIIFQFTRHTSTADGSVLLFLYEPDSPTPRVKLMTVRKQPLP